MNWVLRMIKEEEQKKLTDEEDQIFDDVKRMYDDVDEYVGSIVKHTEYTEFGSRMSRLMEVIDELMEARKKNV